MADDKEIKAGTPTFDPASGAITFPDQHHPKLPDLNKTAGEKVAALGTKAKAIPSADSDKFITGLPEAERATAGQMLERVNAGDLKALHPEKDGKEVAAKVRTFLESHAKDEMKAATDAEKAVQKAHHELRSAQAKALDALNKDYSKIAGHTKDNEEAIKKAVEGFTNEVKAVEKAAKAGGWLGILRTEGFGTAVKHNFSTVGKGVTSVISTGLGAALTYDAFARSQKKGDDGRPVDRSWVARVVEGAVGIAGMGGGLLRGHR